MLQSLSKKEGWFAKYEFKALKNDKNMDKNKFSCKFLSFYLPDFWVHGNVSASLLPAWTKI